MNTHAYGIQAGINPVMHFRKVPGGQLFDHYVQSFDNVWANSKAQRKPAERRRARTMTASRIDYLNDPNAPKATSIVPPVNVV